MIPAAVREDVEATLAGAGGREVRILRAAPVSGGCISPAARVETDDDRAFFLKWGGAGLPAGMLGAEAAGLRSLAATGALRVPSVAGRGGERPWLLLEWLEPGTATADSWDRLGRGLAALHRVRAARFGAAADNYIGPLGQSNDETGDWAEFWRARRLEPRLRAVMDRGLLGESDGRRFQVLFRRLDDLLAPAAADGPSLLHGDLWSGNVHVMQGGEPALIDPSAYHGHREVDLAMAELFGGLGSGYRSAYEEAWPLAPGYDQGRRGAYQLYYLLVHVELFGTGYLSGTRAALGEAGV